MVNINGLTDEDIKTFFDIVHKSNTEQLHALKEHITHEVVCRQEQAQIFIRDTRNKQPLFNKEYKTMR